MRSANYSNITPVTYDEYRASQGLPWLRAVLVIAGSSALLWGLIVYAVWQMV